MRRILIRLIGWEDCVTQMVLQERKMKLSTFNDHCLLLHCGIVLVQSSSFIADNHVRNRQDLLLELGALPGSGGGAADVGECHRPKQVLQMAETGYRVSFV